MFAHTLVVAMVLTAQLAKADDRYSPGTSGQPAAGAANAGGAAPATIPRNNPGTLPAATRTARRSTSPHHRRNGTPAASLRPVERRIRFAVLRRAVDAGRL